MDPEQENPTPQGTPPPDLKSPSVPPPSIPKPNIPPPSIKPVDVPPVTVPPVNAGPPVVPLDEVVAEEVEDDTPEAGQLAQMNPRIIAAVIDMLVGLGLMLLVSYILPGFLSRIGGLLWIGYLLTRDSLPFLGGQSIGKKVMKLQAVTLDGKTLAGNWEPGLIRNAVLAIPFFPIVELIVLLTRDDKPERGYRLGDEWAKTKVITVPAFVLGA